ncbi:putative synaptonemal complex protein 1-like [Penaeus vannamei]|uniref:Putative synaptonemal complex protein 1-like n=1 Tax=Penaeus vannamei TaxID=6689 RepID=A0A423SUT8_PENVA|nr:putative synaptonemal complex protein 1-like [Penaeus vannamei]
MWRQRVPSEGREQMPWDFPARNEQRGRREGTLALEDLHRKLQRETEDLFRWKASTEMTTRQLERQLNEAQVTMADQRRNLMELQLNSENLSQSLIKERKERDLIAAKVMHTRQLSLALTQQKENLAGILSLFQQEKDLLSAAHGDTVEKINELTDGLRDLCVAHRQQVGSIKAQAEEEVRQLQKEIVSKKQELNESKASLSVLAQHHSEYEKKVTELTELLKTTEESFSIAREKNIVLTSEIDEVKNSLESVRAEMEEQMRASTAQLTKLKEELKEEKYRRAESQKEFEEAVGKIQYLKKANDTLEGSKAEILDKLEAVVTRKQELEKDLQHGSSMMAALRAEVTQKVKFLSQCLGEVQTKFSHLESDFKAVQTEKQSLVAQLDEAKGLLHEERQLVCHQKEKNRDETEPRRLGREPRPVYSALAPSAPTEQTAPADKHSGVAVIIHSDGRPYLAPGVCIQEHGAEAEPLHASSRSRRVFSLGHACFCVQSQALLLHSGRQWRGPAQTFAHAYVHVSFPDPFFFHLFLFPLPPFPLPFPVSPPRFPLPFVPLPPPRMVSHLFFPPPHSFPPPSPLLPSPFLPPFPPSPGARVASNVSLFFLTVFSLCRR